MPLPRTLPYLKPLAVGTAPEPHGSSTKARELLADQRRGDKALPQTACCAVQVCQTFKTSGARRSSGQQPQQCRAVRSCLFHVVKMDETAARCALAAAQSNERLAANPGQMSCRTCAWKLGGLACSLLVASRLSFNAVLNDG
jgi:hypothetical protein